jgi:hypothetical protein
MRRWSFAAFAILLWVASAFAGPKQHWSGWSRTPRAFMPYDVPETVAWFSPRHNVTNASGAASAWASLSPSSTYTAAQATAGKRPTIATGINSRASLDFSTLASTELNNTTDNILAGGTARYVLAVVRSNNAGGTVFSFQKGTWLLYAWNLSGTQYYFFDGSAAFGEASGGAPTLLGATFMLEWELTVGATPVVRFNGVARTLAGTIAAAPAGTTGFSVGSANGAQFWDGPIADVYVASPIPSTTNKAKLRTYFSIVNGMTAL